MSFAEKFVGIASEIHRKFKGYMFIVKKKVLEWLFHGREKKKENENKPEIIMHRRLAYDQICALLYAFVFII